MSDGAQREMTLEEWVDKLPEIHRAHKEYRKLRARIEKLEKTIGRKREVIEELENHYASGIFITGDEVQRLGGVVKAIDAYIHGHIFTHAQIKAAWELVTETTMITEDILDDPHDAVMQAGLHVLAVFNIKRCEGCDTAEKNKAIDASTTLDVCPVCGDDRFVIGGGR